MNGEKFLLQLKSRLLIINPHPENYRNLKGALQDSENLKVSKETIMKKILPWFRRIAIAEGISFLVLLFIAMPLKYFAHQPMAVTIAGSIHGFLFITFIILAQEYKNASGKNMKWFVLAFIASILPFGTFVLDKSLKKEEQLLS